MSEEGSLSVRYYGGKGFSASALKLFAVATMLVDHTAVAFSQNINADIYSFMRIVGRTAFPIFAFMIAEGARRTHDIKKYLLRLLIFALISEIPFDITFMTKESEDFLEFSHQNVYFTLFFGLFAVWCLQLFKEHVKHYKPLTAAALALSMAGASFLSSDYGAQGVLCIFIFYVFADKENRYRIPANIASIFLLSVNGLTTINTAELYAMISALPICMYNGKKGIKLNKYFFYGFYPGHIVLLYLLRLIFTKSV